jgi:hypothetical protein
VTPPTPPALEENRPPATRLQRKEKVKRQKANNPAHRAMSLDAQTPANGGRRSLDAQTPRDLSDDAKAWPRHRAILRPAGILSLIFALCLFPFAFVAARAATVTGTFTTSAGVPVTSRITFRPVSSPIISGANVVTGDDILVTPNGSGVISTTLTSGYFEVWVTGTRRFTIAVPSGTGSYNVSALTTTALWVVPATTGISLEPFEVSIATPSAAGIVRIDTASDDPEVYLKDSVDDLLSDLTSDLGNLISYRIASTNGTGYGTTITNGTIINSTITQDGIPQGTYYGTDENDLANNFNPLRYKEAYATDPTIAGDWYWSPSSTATGAGYISVQGYAMGRLIRKQGINAPASLSGGKVVVTDATTKRQVETTATKQQAEKGAMQVATVAAMRALDPAQLNDGQLIETADRVVAGGGGGATYKYVAGDTTTTNLSTVFSFTSGTGRVIDTSKGWLDVRQSGAVADDSTDNVLAITDAVLVAKATGRTLYIPAGNYRTSGTIAMLGGTAIVGDSGAAKTPGIDGGIPSYIRSTATDAPIVTIVGEANSIKNLSLEYVTVADITHTNSNVLVLGLNNYRTQLGNVSFGRGYRGIYNAVGDSTWQFDWNNLYIRSYRQNGIYLGAASSSCTWNQVYVQNLFTEVNTQSATITNIVRSSGTNLAITVSGSLPALLATNRFFVLTGVTGSSSFNTYFVATAISGSTVSCSMASDPGVNPGLTGTLTFSAQYAAGRPVDVLTGTHKISGLDIEHVVTADPIICAFGGAQFEVTDIYFEQCYSTSVAPNLIRGNADVLEIGSVQFVNSGYVLGAAGVLFKNISTAGNFRVGQVTMRDLAVTGATHSLESSTGSAVVVAKRSYGTTFRVNATPTLTSNGGAVTYQERPFGTTGLTLAQDAATFTGSVTINAASGADSFFFNRPGTASTGAFNWGSSRLNATVSQGILTYSDSAANSATKFMGIGPLSYATANSPFLAFTAQAASTENILNLGGGFSVGAAANRINFITTPTVGTVTGTSRGTITSDGKWYIGAAGTAIQRIRFAAATLASGTITVADANTTASSYLFPTYVTAGGTVGALSYTLNAGVGYTINSTSVADTNRVNVLVIEP